MTTRADVVNLARELVQARVPWRHQGTTRRGVDCIGLIGLIAAELGIDDAWINPAKSLPFKGYGRLPRADLIYQACAEFLDPVWPKATARAGDILLIRLEKEPTHFAIQSRDFPVPYMIHSHTTAKFVVENRIDETWDARIVCAYAFRGLTA